MLQKKVCYTTLSDSEWIERLTAFPPDERACKYFFNIKCRIFLKYIANTIFGSDEPSSLLGDFYEYLSHDNWHVLKKFEARNGASLGSYLSRCAVNYFRAKKQAEDKTCHLQIERLDIITELNLFTQEEETEMPPVWQAYKRLCKRDRDILRLLVIDGKSAIEAADTIWPQVKSATKDWRQLPAKRVQDTLSMLKKRALLALSLELRKDRE